MNTKLLSKKKLIWLQYILALIPIIWIFCRLNFSKTAEVLSKTAWWTLPAMISLMFAIMLFNGIRWWVLLISFIPELKLRSVLKYHFIGAFYSIVLPSNASQDVVKSIMISRHHDYSVSWGATWLTKILGLLASAFISLYGLLRLTSVKLPHSFVPSILSAFGVIFVLFLFSFSKRATKPFKKLTGKILPAKIQVVLENVRQGVYLYRTKKSSILYCMILTFVTQFALVLNAIIAIAGITGKFYFAEAFAFIPIIEVIAVSVALTPNGMGVREALTAIMFTYIGLTNEQLGIYVFLGFSSLIIKLLGGIPLLYGAAWKPRASS